MTTVFINNLIFWGFHGLTEKEKTNPQRFLVNISLKAPPAGNQDDISKTVDYRIVKKITESMISNERFELLESLAARIAEEILKSTSAESVTVSISKPDIWENGVPGVTITKERIPAHINLLDFEVEELIETLSSQRGVSIPILSEERRLKLLKEAESFDYAAQPEVIGSGLVREQLSSFTDFDQDGLFYALRNDFTELLIRKFSGFRINPLFSSPLSFNDLSLQKYQLGSIGITPHRDGKSRINLICVFILKGSSEFAICDDRSGTNPKFLDTTPGNVIILRGPGFLDSTFQPFHFVTNIREGRIVFGLRQRISSQK